MYERAAYQWGAMCYGAACHRRGVAFDPHMSEEWRAGYAIASYCATAAHVDNPPAGVAGKLEEIVTIWLRRFAYA